MARFGRNRPKAVVPLADLKAIVKGRDTQLGVLARSLMAAEHHGLLVPDGWVVLADVFRHVVHTALPPGHDLGSLLRTVQRPIGVERAARARERLLGIELDSDLEREIDAAFAALSEASPWGLAVRVSAVLDDHGLASAAGLSGGELPIFDRESFGSAIRRAWAKAVSESTLVYLRGRRVRDLAMAVVVEPVIAARATVTLVTDARALPGSAGSHDALSRLAIAVSGLAIDRPDLSLAEVVQFDSEGGVQAVRPGSARRAPVVRARQLATEQVPEGRELLPKARVLELAEMARRLDPEGATIVRCVLPLQGDAVVVDMRPPEHFGYPGTGTAGTLWGHASVGGSPPGPLLPLSRNMLSRPLVDRARRALGRDAPRPGKLAGIVTSVHGRPYLDLSRLLDTDRGAVDVLDPPLRIELAGAQWTAELAQGAVARISLARTGLRIAQIAAEQRALGEDVNRFEREAELQRRWLAEMDLAILPDDALTTTLHEVRNFLTRAHDQSAQADALALSGHALLSSVLAGVDPSRASWLAHAVVSGSDVVTAKPATALCHVASIARLDEPSRQRMENGGISSPNELPSGPFERALRHFLEAFGDRGLFEAELGMARFGEAPEQVLAMIAASLRGEAVDPDVALSRARALADRQLALLEPGLSFFETKIVRDVVSRQRELLRLRERCRTRVAHGLAMMRVVALDVDRRIRRLDPTLEPGDAFLLTLDELAVAVAKYRADLSPIARARREDVARERRTRNPLAVFRGRPTSAYPWSPSPTLRGLSTSPGVAEGRVVRLGQRLEGIERFVPGDVLVLPALDLGFSPLFFQARAVVAEVGTPFASASVVARGVGIPAVTGIAGASVLLRDGDYVRVDGDGGTVELREA